MIISACFSWGSVSAKPSVVRLTRLLSQGVLTVLAGLTVQAATNLLFNSSPHATFGFDGFVGRRIGLTAANWLESAPLANPGMLEMFQVRDREPAPNLVPWAGEFAGKYLISAIQIQRLGGSVPGLSNVVAQLIASQAEDGYLGPFPRSERLLGHWDLWGHYHCLLALLMWHEQTGDQSALDCAKRAADLVCQTYLDSGRRTIDAGSDEMNLSIIHAFGWLYRETHEARYLRLMHEIEKDWERGGDFVRTGLAGLEFFQTPRPRWEGLHSLQGLVELYRITGEEKYRRAFEHHWRSIARWDLRNTGGFSSGEQATGNPYAPTAIETCCSIAWMALSVDMLKLTGDSRVADLLELATLNAWAGAQHPSGRWCTYSTPMNGTREASAHSIVFQARAGTPELNCCSVNGPRGWGMLADWAAMQTDDGYVLNWLAPFNAAFPATNAPGFSRPDSSSNLRAPAFYVRSPQQRSSPDLFFVSGDYPAGPHVSVRIELDHEKEFTVRIRIPDWSTNTLATLNDEVLPKPVAGTYLTLRRQWNSRWRKPDVLNLTLDLQPRSVPGAQEALGKMSVYRGPLLLAWDQRFNSYDEGAIPALDPHRIGEARILTLPATNAPLSQPLVLLESPGAPNVTLCDFATAGALGTRYRSWLPATNALPAPVVTRSPRDGAIIGPGRIAFRWTGSPCLDGESRKLQISPTEDFAKPAVELSGLYERRTLVELPDTLAAGRYFWRILSSNLHGSTESSQPCAAFSFDPSLAETNETFEARALGPNGEIVRESISRGPLNGLDERLTFAVGEWPEENYSVALRFRVLSFPTNHLGQVFSAWAEPMDDPLRITIDKGRLYARLEMSAGYSTPGVTIEPQRWYQLLATKQGDRLRLLLDGQERASCVVPRFVSTRAEGFALGGNPHYAGNEFLNAEFTSVVFSTDNAP